MRLVVMRGFADSWIGGRRLELLDLELGGYVFTRCTSPEPSPVRGEGYVLRVTRTLVLVQRRRSSIVLLCVTYGGRVAVMPVSPGCPLACQPAHWCLEAPYCRVPVHDQLVSNDRKVTTYSCSDAS